LTQHFGTNSLKGFGVENIEEGKIAAGAILYYLGETQHNKLQHITRISRILEGEYVWMDRFTIRNLELYHSSAQNAVTLLDVIDKTISPMGGRMLKRWLALPLKNPQKIEQRHEAVDFLLKNQGIRQKIQFQIKKIGDLERLISKVATQKITPRETVQLKNSLEAVLPIKELTAECDDEALNLISEKLQSCELLREKINTCL